MSLPQSLAGFVLLLPALGCSFFAFPAPHKPVTFTEAASPHGEERFPNWPMPPAMSLADLRRIDGQRYVFESVDPGVGGTTGVTKDTVYYPDLGQNVRLKVKTVPPDLDGVNNAPRKEIAAYLVQRLFLDPEDYVVTTTFPHCVPVETWNEHHDDKHDRTLDGTDCVLVLVAYWLSDVKLPDPLYEEQRFLTDPNYAYFLSNFNVFTYVIDHRDGREGNFLISRNDARRQVFSVDNGSTFGPLGYNYFVPNWNVLRVAAIRRETVDRLREVERRDLDFLEVAIQMEAGDDGQLHIVPRGESIDPDTGALYRDGVVQLGLTRSEIDAIWERIQRLTADVDAGRIPTF